MAFYNIFMYFKNIFQMRRSYALRKGEISTIYFIITCMATAAYFFFYIFRYEQPVDGCFV
jgi:hypothetical protein